MSLHTEIQAAVRLRLQVRRLTQEKAAHICGVSPSAFEKFLSGERGSHWNTVHQILTGLEFKVYIH